MRNRLAQILELPMMALIQRDLMRSLRQTRPFLVLLGLVLGLSIVVMATWPSDVSLLYLMRMKTTVILGFWCFVLLGALGLFVPAFGATAVVSEREEQTYDILSMTLISPWGIVLAKVVSLLGFYTLLVVGCAPLVATLFFLLGFDMQMFALMMVVLGVTALVCAAASILASALCRRVATALLLSFMFMSWIMGAQFMFVAITGEAFGIRSLEWFAEEFGMVLSPVATMVGVFEPSVGLGSSRILMALLYHVMCAVVVLFLARYLVGRSVEPAVAGDATGRRALTVGQRLRRLVLGRNRRHRSIGRLVNPIYALESRYGGLTRGPVRRRVFVLMLFVCFAAILWLALAGVTPSDGDDFVAIYLGFFLFVVLMGATGVVANTMTKERERGNLDMLRTTLLTPGEIIFGKAKAGLMTVRAVVLAVLIAFVVACLLSPMKSRYVLVAVEGFITLAVCCLVSVSVAMLASASCKRTTTSILVSYLAAAWIHIGMFGTILIFLESMTYSSPMRRWLRSGDPSMQDILLHVSGWLSPPVAFFLNVFEDREYFGPFWITSMLAATLLSVGLLLLARRAYIRRALRDG